MSVSPLRRFIRRCIGEGNEVKVSRQPRSQGVPRDQGPKTGGPAHRQSQNPKFPTWAAAGTGSQMVALASRELRIAAGGVHCTLKRFSAAGSSQSSHGGSSILSQRFLKHKGCDIKYHTTAIRRTPLVDLSCAPVQDTSISRRTLRLSCPSSA